MNAIDICYARLPKEEGVRKFAYNDATGKTVTCKPDGNLSIAIGVNLEIGLYPEEIEFLSRNRLQKVSDALQGYAWYQALDPVRQSVCLDIAFNQGVSGLLHYPKMISYLSLHNYNQAADECTTADAKLDAQRYAPLRELLRNGA